MPDFTNFASGFVSVMPWAAIAGLVGLMWKQRVPMRKLSLEADTSLRADLLKQLSDQEVAHQRELGLASARITLLEEKLEEQRKTYEAKLDYERVTHAGEMASFRHKVNNLEQSLNMLLMLIETNPDKAQEAASKVIALRDKQERLEQSEKTAIMAATVSAAGARRTE